MYSSNAFEVMKYSDLVYFANSKNYFEIVQGDLQIFFEFCIPIG